jgi:hypothetical protein
MLVMCFTSIKLIKKPYMFRSVHRSSSGVVQRDSYSYHLSTIPLYIPVLWLCFSVCVYSLCTSPCGVWMCTGQLPLVNYSVIHSSIVAVCFSMCVLALYQSVRSVDVYWTVHIHTPHGLVQTEYTHTETHSHNTGMYSGIVDKW